MYIRHRSPPQKSARKMVWLSSAATWSGIWWWWQVSVSSFTPFVNTILKMDPRGVLMFLVCWILLFSDHLSKNPSFERLTVLSSAILISSLKQTSCISPGLFCLAVALHISVFASRCACRGALRGWVGFPLTRAADAHTHTPAEGWQSAPAEKPWSSRYLLPGDFVSSAWYVAPV